VRYKVQTTQAYGYVTNIHNKKCS